MIPYVHEFLGALLLTTFSEVFVVGAFYYKNQFSLRKICREVVFVVLFVNLMTLPYVWFVAPYLILGEHWRSLLASEILVLIIESVCYWYFLGISFRKAFLYSLCANVASFSLGYLNG